MIEGVKEFRTKLETPLLSHVERLKQPKIEINQVWTHEGVIPRVAEGDLHSPMNWIRNRGGSSKTTGVKPLLHRVASGGCAPIAESVGPANSTHDSVRRPALNHLHAAELPPTQEGICRGGHAIRFSQSLNALDTLNIAAVAYEHYFSSTSTSIKVPVNLNGG